MRFRKSRAALAIGTLIASAVLAQAPAPTSLPGVLPLDQFTRYDEFGTLQLSPDGEFVAMSLGKSGQASLVFVDIKNNKLTAVLRMPDNLSVSEFHWVSATRAIYMTARRLPGKQFAARTGEIFGTDRDGTHQRLLYGMSAGQQGTGTKLRVRDASYATATVLSSLRHDDRNILVAEYPWKDVGGYLHYDPSVKPRFTRLDVYTGMKNELGAAPLANADLMVDTHDQVRFAWGADSQGNYAVSWKPDAGASWSEFELTGFDPETVVPQRFSSDDRSVFLTGKLRSEAFASLYKLDLETRAVTKVGGFDDADVTRVIPDFADREVVGYSGAGDKSEDRWLLQDDPTAKLHQSLHKAFPGQNVYITSTTEDGRLAVAFVSSDVNPGEYYLFDTQKKTANFLRASREWVDPRLMRPKEQFRFTARDGLAMHGYLTRPTGSGMHPMVVLPHGGPHGVRDDLSFDSEVQLLANRGYTVLQVNYRGSAGYGKQFEEAGYREWGGRMQDDLTDATRWAIEQNIVAADRICIFGASYGGYAALMGAVREPKLYHCAIGMAGIYDLELMLSSGDIPDSISGRAYLDKALGSDSAQLRARSPVYSAERIEIPVLLIHGKSDWRADFEQATRMKDALEKNHKSLEWIALGGEGHGIYDEDSRRQVFERVLAFLDRHLQQPVTVAEK